MTPTQLPKTRFRVLVVQLARLGDTLQSLMALRAAKQLYPQLDICFVAREQFADAAKRVPWIHEVFTFPTEELLGPILRGERTAEQSLGDVARWLSPIVDEPYDLLLNWTFSEASSYLAALVPARIKLGYSRRDDGTLVALDGWSQYTQGVIQGELKQNIHLTDVWTTQLLTALQLHLGEPQPGMGDEAVTSKSFFALELRTDKGVLPFWREPGRKWIAVQIGAAQESKTYPAAHWAKVIDTVLHRHPDYGVILLGGPEDRERESELQARLTSPPIDRARVFSLVGETNFDLWATVISRSQWLMAGDTAAIHLASILGTRVLNISLGPARHVETGPYGNGHYVISLSTREKNSETLPPEAVYGCWSYAVSEWAHRRQFTLAEHFARLGWTKESEQVGIQRSRIRTTDEGGGVYYEPMLSRPISMEEWSALVVGCIARAWYCGWTPPTGQEVSRDRLNSEFLTAIRSLNESVDVMSKITGEAMSTARALESHCKSLKSERLMPLKDREEISRLGLKLQDLDQLIDRTGATQAPLAALSRMSKVLMHSLEGQSIVDLGRESAESYEQLAIGVEIYRDWIKHTLNLVRPMAVLERSKPRELNR